LFLNKFDIFIGFFLIRKFFLNKCLKASTANLISNPLSILSMGASGSKKGQLAPISFTNKSVDLKEAENESNNHESSKFNTSNYSDIYSEVKATTPESKVTTSFDKKFGFNHKEKSEKKEETKSSTKTNNLYSFKNEENSNKDKEFDDQFSEVILEEIENENKNKINISNIDDFEDSKKYVTQSNSNPISMGYDNSVTNYRLDEFDHIEEVELPK
jgi:hypothetical protein